MGRNFQCPESDYESSWKRAIVRQQNCPALWGGSRASLIFDSLPAQPVSMVVEFFKIQLHSKDYYTNLNNVIRLGSWGQYPTT